MRWTHIASMTLLVGGAIGAALGFLPSAGALPESERSRIGDQFARRLRSWILIAIAAVVGSGLYNLLHKTNLPPGYHMWFGIKMLFALHVIAVWFLACRTGIEHRKRTRQIAGIAISGVIILALSAFLRSLSLA